MNLNSCSIKINLICQIHKEKEIFSFFIISNKHRRIVERKVFFKFILTLTNI